MSEEVIDAVLPEIIDPEEINNPDPQPEPEEKVPKGVQKRIDEVTRQKHEAQRKYDQAQADAAALRREIEQLKSNQPKPEAKTLPNGAPDPDKYPAGRYDPDYLEALTDYKVELRFQGQQKLTEAEKQQQRVAVLEEKARESYPDYADATQKLFTHPLTKVEAFRDIVMDAENPAELSYFLGKNPDELDKISQMTPTQAIRYVGRLEAKIAATPSQETEIKPVSSAPKPIAPLVSAKSTAVTKDPAKMTMAEYAEYRRNQAK